jgi:hypothetical protein
MKVTALFCIKNSQTFRLLFFFFLNNKDRALCIKNKLLLTSPTWSNEIQEYISTIQLWQVTKNGDVHNPLVHMKQRQVALIQVLWHGVIPEFMITLLILSLTVDSG